MPLFSCESFSQVITVIIENGSLELFLCEKDSQTNWHQPTLDI